LKLHTQTAKIFVEAGADLNHVIDDGRTLLDMVFDRGSLRDFHRFLISRGAKTGSEMRRGAHIVAQNGSAEGAHETDSNSDSGFESGDSGGTQRFPKAHRTATRPTPPTFTSYVGPPTNADLQVSKLNADSFNVSREMAAIDISSALQNAPQHAVATPAHSELPEVNIESPWSISQFIRAGSTPTSAFLFE
jgi:hypothetical protein